MSGPCHCTSVRQLERSCGIVLALAVGALNATTLATRAAQPDAPNGEPAQRIVSINVCADQLVLALAPREAIVSLSFLARSTSHAALHAQVGDIPLNRGGAEEVLALAPDLVVAGRYTTRATVTLLRGLGVNVFELDLPSSIAQAVEQIRTTARVLGRAERGETVISRLEARLRRSRASPGGVRPLAVLYRPNGFTAGTDTLAGDVLAHAGFDNLATRAGIETFGHLPLERLIVQRPDVIIFDELASAPSLAVHNLAHPVFERLARNSFVARVPARLWTCGGPWIADAAERLSSLHPAKRD